VPRCASQWPQCLHALSKKIARRPGREHSTDVRADFENFGHEWAMRAAQAHVDEPETSHSEQDLQGGMGSRCRPCRASTVLPPHGPGPGVLHMLTRPMSSCSPHAKARALSLAAQGRLILRFRCRGSPPNWAESWPRSAPALGDRRRWWAADRVSGFDPRRA